MKQIILLAFVFIFVLPVVFGQEETEEELGDQNITEGNQTVEWYNSWVSGSVRTSCGNIVRSGVLHILSPNLKYDVAVSDGYYTVMLSGLPNDTFEFYVDSHPDSLNTYVLASNDAQDRLNIVIPLNCSSINYPDADKDGIPDNFDACPNSDTEPFLHNPVTDIYGCNCYQKTPPYCGSVKETSIDTNCCSVTQTCIDTNEDRAVFCQDSSCSDNIQNDNEEGVDCGGVCPDACKCEPRGQCIPDRAPKFCLGNGTTINSYSQCGCPVSFTYDSVNDTCIKTVAMKGMKCKTNRYKVLFSLFRKPNHLCRHSLGNDWVEERSYRKAYKVSALQKLLPLLGLAAPLAAPFDFGLITMAYPLAATAPLYTTLCIKTEDNGCVPRSTICRGSGEQKETVRDIEKQIKDKYKINVDLGPMDITMEADEYSCPDVTITSDLYCEKIIENGPSESQIDVLFISDGILGDAEFKSAVINLADYNNTGYRGLFSEEPFTSNKAKFNVWALNGKDFIGHKIFGLASYGLRPKTSDAFWIAEACPFKPDQIVVLSVSDYTSFGAPGLNLAACSVGGYINWRDGTLLLHEFGHSFGKLNDEYYNYIEGYNTVPYTGLNCQTTQEGAEAEWGDIAGTGTGEGLVGYYSSCGDNTESGSSLIRPTANSIMKNKDEYGFFDVNKRIIEEQIKEQTGSVITTGDYALRK